MDRGSVIGILAIVGVVALWNYDKDSNKSDAPGPSTTSFSFPSVGSGSSEPEPESIARDDAIADHWDEIKEYLNGTEAVEACSQQSGRCYNLDADISVGTIDTIHFPNGGWRSLGADIDSDGSASDNDDDGDLWNMNLDMDSSTVDDAIQEWADSNGITVE